MNRLSQSAFDRPTKLTKASRQSYALDSQFLSPRDKRLGFSLERNQVICALVASLLRPSGPLAVILRISKRVVDSLNTVFGRWSRSHIFVKRRKRFPPVVANPNVSTPVITILAIVGVIAALEHAPPRFVFGRMAHSMSGVPSRDRLVLEAPATLRASFAKTCASHGVFLTAVAFATPCGLAAIGEASVSKHNQPSETLPSQVYDAGRNSGRIHSSHVPVSLGIRNVVRTVMQHQLRGCSHCSLTATERQ